MRLPGIFHRPWLAVIMALVAVGISVAMREFTVGLALADLARATLVVFATTLPLLAAGILIPLLTTSRGFASAVGLTRVSLSEVGLGICAGLVLRAVTEIVAPTVGTVNNPFGGGIAPAVVLALVVAVAVSPFVEEVLFRGVLQRALADGMRSVGAVAATALAIALTTTVFVLSHATFGQMQIGLLISTIAVGVICGLLAAMTGRLTAAVAAHTVHNGIGVALLIW